MLMWQLRNRAILVSFLSVVASRIADAQVVDKARDASGVIQKTAEVHRHLRSYQLERSTTISETNGRDKAPKVAVLKFLSATRGAEPIQGQRIQLPVGRSFFNFTMETKDDKWVFIANSREGWWFDSRENLFTKGIGYEVIGPASSAVIESFHSYPFLILGSGAILEPRIEREEKVEVGKGFRTCVVIKGTVKHKKIEDLLNLPDFDPVDTLGMELWLNTMQVESKIGDANRLSIYSSRDDETKVTLWIDKSDHALIRSESTCKFKKAVTTKDKKPVFEEEVSVTLTEAFSVVNLNTEVAEKVFQFSVPPGAKEALRESGGQPK